MLHEWGFGVDFLLFLFYFFFSLFLPLALKFPLERRVIKGKQAGDVAGLLSSTLCPSHSPHAGTPWHKRCPPSPLLSSGGSPASPPQD